MKSPCPQKQRNQGNLNHVLFIIIFMKQIAFILVCCVFNLASCLVTQAPIWTTNPNLDAGEVVAANQASMPTYMAASTVKSFSQHYNRTTFASPPKVVLAMIGYTQAAPGSPLTDFGFQPVITGIAQLTFTYTITVYGSMVYDLRYLYLAVLEPTPNYYMGIITQQFSSSSNLNNSGAAQRWDTLTFANPGGWVNSAYASSDVQVLAFPIGYKLAAQSGRSYFSINATIFNESHYSVNISTIGTNKLSQLDFSILMFNRAPLQADYVAYQDIALFNVIGNTSYYFLPTITASQYMFRNCLTGAVHIQFNLISVALVGFYYGVSSANDDFFVWKTFNNRVRNCPANVSYYEPVSGMCQDTCAPYYYVNTTSKLCVDCHPSCYSCTQPATILGCLNCSSADHRSLINSSCVCDAGYYDSGASACSTCNYRCLTCSSTPLCLTCNANLSRTLSNSSECLCITGYFQNTTCISCGTVTGCLTCSYNTTDSNFTCFTCNSSLFRTLSSDNKTCICLTGYYEEASTCKPCPVGCLSCTFDGVNPICNNCNTSLQRTMGASNYTCDCISSYYADSNNSCNVCPLGCLACSYNGSTPICSSCNASLQRTMGTSNLTCDCLANHYLNSSSECLPCPLGCLSCSLNASQLVCSTCDSSLDRILSSNNTACICKVGFYENSSQLCSPCQYGCLDCYFSSNLTCRSCNPSRAMASSNFSCDCPAGSYESANLSCLSCPTNCSTCSSGTFCTSCAIGSYLHTNNSCLTCSLGCLNCHYNSTSSVQVCLNCSGNLNFILQSSSCVCASNYTLNGTTCTLNTTINNATNTTNTTNTTTSPCGNGIKQAGQQCDDGNTVNSDGCSSVCAIQNDHTCVDNSSLYNHSLCYYSRQIQFNPSLIYKKPGQNSVKIVLIVIAPNCNPSFLKTYLQQASALALFDRTRRLLSVSRQLQSTSWISVPTKSMIFDQNTGQLIIQFDYDASIDLTKKYIQFIPSTSTTSQGIKYFYASPSSELTLSQPYNHLSTTYYSSSDLSAVSGIRYGFLILVVLYWIFLILTLSRNRGVVGVECMLILQFTYFILLDQKPLLESWSGLQLTGKYSFGFNPTLFPSSYSADLNALELDGSLFNTFGLTLIICCLLFSFIVINCLREYIKQRKNQQSMQINDTQENSIKLQKEGPPTNIEKIMVYVIDTFLSLLFLSVGVLFIVVLFTNSSNFTINITATALFVIVSIVFWILLVRNRKNYSYSRISFTSILINANKTTFHPLVKKAFANYYLLLFVLLIIAALITAALRKTGIVVLALLAVGCVLSIVFHLKFKIYFEMLDSKRCIINSCGLLLLIVIHGVCLILGTKLGTGFSMVIIAYVVLLLILAANVLIFVLVTKKQLKREEEEEIHNKEMQQMDNELALANISFIGKGYNSINQSREFSKEKDFLNSLDMSSAKKCLLNDEKQGQLVTMIEEKIRELKDFKKNIQAQLQTSQPSDQPQGSEANNLTLQNVLGDLNFTKNSNDGLDIEAI